MKLGLQMWSINDVCLQQGMRRAMEQIAPMGYQGFEFALGRYPTLWEMTRERPADVAQAMKDNGVEPIGIHIGLNHILERTAEVIDEMHALGVPYAGIAPAFYGDREPHPRQKALYADVVRAAKLLKAEDIQMQVHCAVFGYLLDYKERPTSLGMIEEAGIDLLQPEFDTAWVICSGLDPAELLRMYKGHTDVLHFKDYHPCFTPSPYILVDHNTIGDYGYGCAVGDNGVQDVKTIVDAAREAEVKWVVTELWNEENALENAAISAKNILACM